MNKYYVLMSVLVAWLLTACSGKKVSDGNSSDSVVVNKEILMLYGGWIGENYCFDFQVNGDSGYYLLTPEDQGGVKRTLSLESFNSTTGECILNAYLNNNYIGKFEGKASNIEEKDGRYLCDIFAGEFISVKDARLDFSLRHSNIPAGLTFRTFTKKKTLKDYNQKSQVVQSSLGGENIAKNLKRLGFKLLSKKTESRLDYTGQEYEDITIETYSKEINGNTTTVKLESDYTEIHFPNLQDVEEFKQSAINCGLKNNGTMLEDNPNVYWDGTNVEISGTIVTLHYKWEA